MSFRLEGTVKDWELFESYMNAGVNNGGKVFYQEDDHGNLIKAVYFSGTKMLVYKGEVDRETAKIIKAYGHKVRELVFTAEGVLKIVQ